MRTPHEYTDTAMDMYNVVYRARESGLLHKEKHSVALFMRPLLAEISKKNPSWWFIDSRAGDPVDGVRIHNAFDVVTDDGEELGAIWRDWRGDSHVFAINNRRLADTRTRGRATMTKNLKDAVKVVTKSFYAPTPTELLTAARRNGSSSAQGLYTAAYMDFNRAEAAVKPIINAWLLEPTAADVLVKLTAFTAEEQEKLRALPELGLAKRATADFGNRLSASGHAVLMRGSDYFVSTTGAEDLSIERYTEQTLPDHIKGNVGMLKLVDPKTAVLDVGVRVDDNTFLVPSQEAAP